MYKLFAEFDIIFEDVAIPFIEYLISIDATLQENTVYFRSRMEKLGFTLGGDGKHAITPVMLMEEKLATEMAEMISVAESNKRNRLLLLRSMVLELNTANVAPMPKAIMI